MLLPLVLLLTAYSIAPLPLLQGSGAKYRKPHAMLLLLVLVLPLTAFLCA